MEQEIIATLERSRFFNPVFEYLKQARLRNWYVTAGFIQQTYFNARHGYALENALNDIDIAYFDARDASLEEERKIEAELSELIGGRLKIDVKNQARVHLWYHEKFGYPIAPYADILDAIDSFPTTSTALGITAAGNEKRVYATFGLADLHAMILRPNKKQLTRPIYETKAEKIRKHWPLVTIMAWDEAGPAASPRAV